MNRFASPIRGMFLATALVLGVASVARADDYKIDPMHSSAVFRVHHFGAGYIYGTFAGPSGDISYDATDASKTSFNVTIDVTTIDTRVPMRDKDLKGPDFFDVKQFPTATFKSTSVKKTGDTTMDVTGDLTLHGVTKSITVSIDATGTGKGMKGETRAGFETTFSVDRRDFGITYDPEPVIGNDIRIMIGLEGIAQ
jgi:polyisoprenoid-binding protein YceI